VETVGERERESVGRVNTMTAAFCVDCGLKLTRRYCGKCGRDYGASVSMQEPGDDDDNNEEDEEGVEEEGLASSSDDDTDGIVEMVVRGKRMRLCLCLCCALITHVSLMHQEKVLHVDM
jgi:hypothetical protein